MCGEKYRIFVPLRRNIMELLITKYPKEPILGGTKYMFTYTVKLVYKGH